MKEKVRCVAYLRLSKEEKNTTDQYSESIDNQRLYIKQYISAHKEWKLTGEYIDDGYSGSNFIRPGIQRLFADARGHQFDCVIVKDLSRFGREYLDTGRYLQQFFPLLGIRFIAISDAFDSKECSFFEQNLYLPIMNLMNDAYCQDISKKVRAQQEAKRKEGKYIGAFPVYGYRKKSNNHNELEIDEPVADVVRWIFERRIEGNSPEILAFRLNEKNILSPLAYKKSMNSRFYCSFAKTEQTVWSPVAVRRILKNEIYIGNLIQGKQEKISYKLSERRKKSQEEWICVPNIVPPIISKEVYQKAQIPLKRKIKGE